MNALATFAKYGVWLLWIYLAVMAVGSAWLLWHVIAHTAAAVRRRRIPRIPATKPLAPWKPCPDLLRIVADDQHMEAELRRLGQELRDEFGDDFTNLLTLLPDRDHADDSDH